MSQEESDQPMLPNSANEPLTIPDSLRIEREQTYLSNLKEQIQYKKKLTKIARSKIESLEIPLSNSNNPKLKTVALLETLNKLPYQPPREDLIGSSLLEYKLVNELENIEESINLVTTSNKSLQKELDIQKDLSNLLDSIESNLGNLKSSQLELNSNLKSYDKDGKLNELNGKILEMKTRSKKLVGYSKTLIVDYILSSEFRIFNKSDDGSITNKKAKFLKLLEIMLNNSIGLVEGNGDKSLEIENKDDPLIRYLILNNIVVVDKKNPNRIRLRDLTMNV